MELIDIKSESKPDPKIELDYTYTHDGYLIPHLGNLRWDGHIFVSGATGAGKSFLINQILLHDKLLRKIYMFSDLDEDESITVPTFSYQEGDDLTDSICIFDDFKDITLRDHLLEKGRHTNTMVVCVNHKLRDYKWTKKPLNESKWVIVFPSANAPAVFNELLAHGLKREEAKKILQLSLHDGRYLMIHQHAPNAYVTQRSIVSNVAAMS